MTFGIMVNLKAGIFVDEENYTWAVVSRAL